MRDFSALEPGHVLGQRYRVEAKVGEGRSSTVYRARDLESETAVALKVLDPFLAQDEVNLERFRREVAVIRSLQHPNIIKLYDFFQDAELRVISMELVDGSDLGVFLEQSGPLPVRRFLALACSMLSAVDACHRQMILHRDIKPQNILVDRHGEIRLADFGISKINSMSDLTKTGTAVGSPEYMAPELFRSTRADPRSDIYSLGAVMYEMLTGRPPYLGDSLASIMTQQLESEIESASDSRPELPPWIESIVSKCLRTDPNARYQSIAEVSTELEREERALCTYEARNRSVRCLGCQSERVPGLPFCQDCGVRDCDLFEAGEHSVVIYRADEPELLAEGICRLFPGASRRPLQRRLARGPALLVRGVDEASARNLFNELASLYCEISIVRSLPAELRLPSWLVLAGVGVFAALYATLGNVIGLPVGAGIGKPVLLASFCLLASQGPLLAAYRLRIRPLVAREQERGASGGASALTGRLAGAIRELGLGSSRRILGHMAASLLALRAREAQLAPVHLDDLEALVLQCCRAAQQLERLDVYLSSRSLMGIAQQLAIVEIRLAKAREAAVMEELVSEKVELEAELATFHSTQDRHARATLTLLNVNGTLEKLCNAARSGESLAPYSDELDELASDLRFRETSA